MTTPFLFMPIYRAFDNAGAPLAGGLLYTYVAGTTNAKATYSDAAGLIANTNPVVLDSTGSATVRLIPGAYHLVQMDSTGTTTLWDEDYYTAPYLTAADIGGLIYPQTAAEIAASAIIANYVYPPGIVDRYGVNASPGTKPMNGAVQAAVNQMLYGGQPVRYLAGAYLHTAAITFGSTSTNMFPIDIGGAGNLTQVLNANPANTPTFDLTGRSGSYVHDLLLTGSSANKNDGIRIGTNGTGGSSRMRIENITGFMAGHLIYGAYCNTIEIINPVSWPDNGSTLIQVAQSVTPSDVLDHIYFEGDFAHDITIRGGSVMPNTSYSSTGGGVNRGIKNLASQSYNFRVYDTLAQGENGSNTLIGVQIGGGSSNVEGAIVQGVYHENSLLQFNNTNRSVIRGNTNGGSGGGMAFQNNSTANVIDGNSELGTIGSVASVTITDTAGKFACTCTGLAVGHYMKLSGTYGGTGSITGYSDPTTYYISATDGTSTFTLQTIARNAIVTTAGTPTGITYADSPALYFDSSSIGSKYDAGFTAVADNGSTANFRNSGISAQAGGTLNNTLTYSTSMTPDVAAGKRIRIIIPNGHTSEAATLNNPTNLTVGDIIQVAIINNTGGSMGTFTFGSMFKLASATPTMPANQKQRCWLLAYDGTYLTVVGNEPSADTGF